MKRLSQFEDVFTELMVGFALAILLAIWLAPTNFFNWDSVKIDIYELEIKSVKEDQVLKPGEWEFRKAGSDTTIQPNSVVLFTKNSFPEIKFDIFHTIPYPVDINSGIFLMIVLWIVKYVHESSVMKFHNPEGLKLLKFGRILIFISKIGFLFSLYTLIIKVYFANSGHFHFLGLTALFVLFGYMLPDFIQVLLKEGTLKENYKLFSKQIKNLPDNSAADKALMIWCREDILNLLFILVVVSMFSLMEKVENVVIINKATPWIIAFVLIFNLFDWIFNHRFFWGSNKSDK